MTETNYVCPGHGKVLNEIMYFRMYYPGHGQQK